MIAIIRQAQQVIDDGLKALMQTLGSVVRGEETPESDIDILVELKEPGERPALGLRWFGLEEELSRPLGREVELVEYMLEELGAK